MKDVALLVEQDLAPLEAASQDQARVVRKEPREELSANAEAGGHAVLFQTRIGPRGRTPAGWLANEAQVAGLTAAVVTGSRTVRLRHAARIAYPASTQKISFARLSSTNAGAPPASAPSIGSTVA